jgi:PTH1 family peptidyl-tRNA hydrolase
VTSQDLSVVVGLGNPGQRYARTRHNVGFLVVDALAARLGVNQWRERFDAQSVLAEAGQTRLVLAKPMTFMNQSGRAVRQLVAWYRVSIDRLLVVHDDVDLPFGTLRVRLGGGSGGHHGVESIIAALGTSRFARLRLGIGRPSDGRDVTAYVLSRFRSEEEALLADILETAADAALTWCLEGIVAAMNRFNRFDRVSRPRENHSAGASATDNVG